MKAIHCLIGALVLAAAILAVLVSRHVRSSPEAGDDVPSAQNHAATGRDRIVKSREGDPDRYRRIAERLDGEIAGTAMREAAGEGMSRLHQMADSLDSEDFAGVLRELALIEQGKPGVFGGSLRLKLLLVWTERDPAAASSFVSAEKMPAEECRIVAGAWAKSDPAAAEAWARGLPDGERQEAFVGLAKEATFHNPKQAIKLAREAGGGPVAEEILIQSAGAWASKDPQDAANWAKEEADGTVREKLLAGVAMSWADHDPYAAATLVIDSVSDGSLEENALVGIVQRIAFRDPEHARDWVAQFPVGRLRERAEMELERIAGRSRGAPPQ